MQDAPSAAELATAVREFMETSIAPALSGHTAFHARVAMNVLAILERELDQGPGARAREGQRLADLLGQAGDLESLNRALAMGIREGTISLDHPGLADHLRATAIDKVSIDQPRYSGLKDALA